MFNVYSTCDIMYEFLSRISSLNPCCVLKLMEDTLASVILLTKMIKRNYNNACGYCGFPLSSYFPLSTASRPEADITLSLILRLIMNK